MKREFRINASDIMNNHVYEASQEINKMIESGEIVVPTQIDFDATAAASHICYTDEDFVVEYDDGKIPNPPAWLGGARISF